MGSTFTWIFHEQLDRLQEGDRYYYFNQLKDAPLLLADIGSQHFSDIIMRNTGLDHMHYAAFKVSEKIELGARERSHDFSALPVSPDKVLVLVGNKRDNTITGTAGDDTIYGEDGRRHAERRPRPRRPVRRQGRRYAQRRGEHGRRLRLWRGR